MDDDTRSGGLIAWHSINFVRLSLEFGDTLLGGVPAWALQLVLPIGFGLMAYRHSLHALKRLGEFISGASQP